MIISLLLVFGPMVQTILVMSGRGGIRRVIGSGSGGERGGLLLDACDECVEGLLERGQSLGEQLVGDGVELDAHAAHRVQVGMADAAE